MASYLDQETKKVRFKERDGDADVEMVVDLDSQPKVSWKQMLIGKGVSEQEEGSRSSEVECTEDFEFLEGDVQKNYCQCLWRPSKPFHLMDIENGHYLAKLQCVALSQGPWIIYGQYLIIQHWTKSFNPKKPYPRRKDERYGRISVGVSEKLKDNGKMAAQNSGKSKEGFKNGIVGNLGDSNNDLGNGFFEAGSRPKGDFRKIKEIMGHNKVGGGPGSLTNGASRKSKLGEIRFKWVNGFGPKTQEETDLGLRSVG
ncbi:hypothetical protein Gogos_016761 [Gossypium gossypioides]|uniref:DUF4283 domain-containing protein n=1 Tax=Gossypium gossypioides TaxID=34282 RepID=A0A7J9B8S4_GOSGO|nr:hypothetical protein [Gossypium gossypioides]